MFKKQIFLIIFFCIFCTGLYLIRPVDARPSPFSLRGKILLQVEKKGEAWYINPNDGKRYYFKDGNYSLRTIQQLGIGISNENLSKIPVGLDHLDLYSRTDQDGDRLPDELEMALGTNMQKADTDKDGYSDWVEVSTNHNPLVHAEQNKDIMTDKNFVNQVKGKILIQVENRGEAWYVNLISGKRYYLSSPETAFKIVRLFGIGATNQLIESIDEGFLTRQRVVRVIDGDTIELESGKLVRYIGVDTPELDYDDCFGQNAKEVNRLLVENKEVDLIQDVSVTDKYGRILAYVYADGVFVNEHLVKFGYAYALSYAPDVKYSSLFSEHQRTARYERRGLWGECFK